MTKSIYNLTLSFPDSEKFGLVSQLRRASVSICSNIAEGTSRISDKDKAHFISMSYSSTMEVLNQLILSYELEYIRETNYSNCRNQINSITNKLNSLRNYILKDKIYLKSGEDSRGIGHARTKLIEWSKKLDPHAYIFWLDADDQYTRPCEEVFNTHNGLL